MKKIIGYLVLGTVWYSGTLKGQTSTLGNTFSLTTDYLGWDATTGSPPLNIKTTNANPINFLTTNTQRMTILSGGNVGIGTASPVTGLHLNSTGTVGHFHFLVLWQ